MKQYKHILKNREDAASKLRDVIPMQRFKDENWKLVAVSHGGLELANQIRAKLSNDINFLFSESIMAPNNDECEIARVSETEEIVIIDQYSKELSGINVDNMQYKMNEYKKLYFNASDYKENMYDFLSMYCEANDIEIVENIEDANIICSYNDIKDLKDNQQMFNISNNLDKIIGLLA